MLLISLPVACQSSDGVTELNDPDFGISATIPATLITQRRLDTLKNSSVLKSILFTNHSTQSNYGIVSLKTPYTVNSEILHRYADAIAATNKCTQLSKADTTLNKLESIRYDFHKCPPFGHKGLSYFIANKQFIYTLTVDYVHENQVISDFLTSIKIHQ